MDDATARLVLRHAVARGWLPAAQAAAGEPRLVADALVRRLGPQARAELDALARPSVAPSVGPSPGGPAAPPAGDARARAVAALRDAVALDPRFAPHVGLVLETKGLLGEGGMGTVHEVLDRRLGRLAALKVMKTEGADAAAARRFVREAEVTARLDHPAIPPVYEAGTDDRGRQYLLMRRIQGEPLSRRIAAAHVSARPDRGELRALVEVLVKVGEAVAYAHGQGVVHRDLKPANIMVGRFGEVLVMDWGLVRLLGQAEDDAPRGATVAAAAAGPGLTQEGAMGTPGYMPPEQVDDPSAVDGRADVFALGAILCEVLTGEGPIEGTTALNRLTATARGEIARPRDRWPHVPPPLDAIAAAALAADRDARTPTVEAFVADLRAWLADEPVACHREGPRERLARAARRRPGLLVGAPLLVAGLGVAGAVAADARGRAERARLEAASAAEATSRVQTARAALDRSLALLAEADEAADDDRAADAAALVSQALAATDPTKMMLLAAARALDRAPGLDREAERLLERAAGDAPTAADLLALHRMQLGHSRNDSVSAPTSGMRRLLELARARGDPADPWLWTARAIDALGADRSDEGERLLDEAVRLPRSTIPRLFRAEVRAARGNHAGAVEDCEAALRTRLWATYQWRTRLLLADSYLRTRRFQEAAVSAEKALSVRSSSHEARYLLAVARNRLGDHAAALDALKTSADREAAGANELAERAKARWELGDRPGAAADVARALKKEPRCVLGLVLRAEEAILRNELAAAEQDLRAANEIAPTDSAPYETTGVAAALVGNVAVAEEWLTLVIDEAGERRPQPRCHLFRGVARLKKKDVKAALADLDRAVALGSPGYMGPLAWYYRGHARVAAGDPLGAVADWRRYLEVETARPELAAQARRDLDALVEAMKRP